MRATFLWESNGSCHLLQLHHCTLPLLSLFSLQPNNDYTFSLFLSDKKEVALTNHLGKPQIYNHLTTQTAPLPVQKNPNYYEDASSHFIYILLLLLLLLFYFVCFYVQVSVRYYYSISERAYHIVPTRHLSLLCALTISKSVFRPGSCEDINVAPWESKGERSLSAYTGTTCGLFMPTAKSNLGYQKR